MRTVYNRGFCAWCAEPADDWLEDNDGNILYVCDKHECHVNLERELREQLWEMERKYY